MKIAFVDIGDPTDPGAWSGTPSQMINGFSGHSEITVIKNVGMGIKPIYMGHKLFYRMVGRRFDEQRTKLSLDVYSRRLCRELGRQSVDAVIAPGSVAVAHLDYARPVAFWTDSCIGSMVGYYDDFTRLCTRSRREGDAQERAALRRCDLAIYSSEWAAEECRRLYPESHGKVHVVPFGANLDPGLDVAAAKALVEARPTNRCHLLFVGVDWKRKGGDVALATCHQMNAAGIPTSLTVVGCQPFQVGSVPPNVEVLGRLNYAVPEERERLSALFRRSHFLILPSRAECSAIVLCEAAAFAVPSVATRTGGLASIIDDPVTGRLLPPDVGGPEFAIAIRGLFGDTDRYREVAMAAFRKYRTCLNWGTACETVLALLEETVSKSDQSGSTARPVRR